MSPKSPSSTPAFKQAYASLNPAQKQAVDAIDGPVMVIAGPGTGKTQILATRIANILLKTDTDPSAILALTFTDSGSQAMRQRLFDLIGLSAYRVHISTFHSFASSIIQEFPDYFIYSANAKPLTDLQRFQILQNILRHNDFHKLKPLNSPFYFLETANAIPGSISDLKREGVTPEKLKLLLDEELKELDDQKEDLNKTEFDRRHNNLLKNIDLLKIYSEYQDSLKKQSLFDFDDMINWVLLELEKVDSELLSVLQERFHYFLIDEYQDTTSAQNDTINLLASYWGDSANVFVVGDDEQSILRFAGASLENPTNFKKTYPSTKVITLIQNYRSQQNILDAARAVIEKNTHNLQSTFPQITRTLKSNSPHPLTQIKVSDFTAQILEHFYLAKQIQELLNDKISPSKIAVIASTNSELASIAQVFNHLKIPFEISGNQDLLHTTSIKYLLKLFTVVLESRTAIDDLNLFTVLHYPFLNFNHLDILKTTRAAAKQKLPLIDFIHSDHFKNLNLTNSERFTDLLHQLAHFNSTDSTKIFTEFFEIFLKESGLLNWALNNTDSSTHIQNLNSLFSFIKQLSLSDHQLNLASFLSTINLLEQNNLKLQTPDLELTGDKVTLTTAHKSKGLEWEYVYITGCIDGRWGNKTSRSLITLPDILKTALEYLPLEEERRLFYVALTRAKKQVTITYANQVNSFNRLREATPSQFIFEIPENLIERKRPKLPAKEIDKLLQALVNPAVPELVDEQEAALLTQILKNFKLSVTALNNYLDCPYLFKLKSLLKVPNAKQDYLAFGTAVHSALEKFFKHHKKNATFPSKDYLLQSFEDALKNEILTDHDHKKRLSQGKKVLSAYFDFHLTKADPALETEKYFGSTYNPIFLDDIPLSGKVDRIDWLNPTQKTVKVIDYKTGKRKTRGQIEGTTQDSDGSLKRQLVFYQLLSELDKLFPAKVTAVELDFVTHPHEQNKSGKEVFTISPEEIEELKAIIKDSMANIRSLKFPRTTDYSICHRCDFKDHCWPKGIPITTSQNIQGN